MAWAKNGTPNTLGSAGDDLDITDLTAYKFNLFLAHTFATGGNTRLNYTLDNTGANDYAYRSSINGGTDSTETYLARFNSNASTSADDNFEVTYGINIDSEEKLFIQFHIQNNGSGSGNAPDRTETVAKKDTSTDTGQYTRIDINNDSTGDYNTGSNLSALGTD